MCMSGWDVGDIIAISQLALKVHSAYKDAPKSYRHISEEVMSLQIIISEAVKHFETTNLSGNDRQEGEVVLESCRSVLVDLNSLIEEYKSSPSVGTEDIATLRGRLISNTRLLNGVIQRYIFRQPLSY